MWAEFFNNMRERLLSQQGGRVKLLRVPESSPLNTFQGIFCLIFAFKKLFSSRKTLLSSKKT